MLKINNRCFCNALNPNLDFINDPVKCNELKTRIAKRKGSANIDLIVSLNNEYLKTGSETIKNRILNEILKIPNSSYPGLPENEPIIVKTINSSEPKQKMYDFEAISQRLKFCKTDNIANYTGTRSYYLTGQLAMLESALIKYTLYKLIKSGFQLISVPDILPKDIIASCGMQTESERTQIYILDEKHGTDLCLSGTAEMGIAYYLKNKIINEKELPLKFAALSRCFRAETSDIAEEKGLYRVHQFNKVEMFAVTKAEDSEKMLKEFVDFQVETYTDFGLSLRILDMPECELGPQAYRKFDVEAFMPGKKIWGELSSASNCTDYQAKRLNIKCDNNYLHTINGTACAAPRLLIALVETHQKTKNIEIPKVLLPYTGFNTIGKTQLPQQKSFKNK